MDNKIYAVYKQSWSGCLDEWDRRIIIIFKTKELAIAWAEEKYNQKYEPDEFGEVQFHPDNEWDGVERNYYSILEIKFKKEIEP